jgi:hypothetical protein
VPDSLLYHPGLEYRTTIKQSDGRKYSKKLGKFPVMIAKLTCPDGKIGSLHRTYLYFDGSRANVDTAKKLMSKSVPSLKGAVIQIVNKVHPVLHVTEGIETCLAVEEIAEIGSFWAAGNAVQLEQVEIPDYVTDVYIWADRDLSSINEKGLEIGLRGQRAAEVLEKRIAREGLRVHTLLPPIPANQIQTESVDWLDVLNTYDLQRLRRSFALKQEALLKAA